MIVVAWTAVVIISVPVVIVVTTPSTVKREKE